MKLLPMLLLNLATVGVGIVVYDHLRSDPQPERVVVAGGEVETDALEQRIRDLEAERGPGLTVADPRLLERIAALEEAARSRAGGTDEPGGRPVLNGRAPPRAFDDASDEPPTADEIRYFRRLRDAANRQDRIERNATRVDKALAKLSLNLSKRQRERIHAAFTDFEPKVKYFWDEAKKGAHETRKAGGKIDRGRIVEDTTTLIQDEFAKTINDVLAQADAEAVAKALMPGGR